jgi:hypothetical protein
MSVKIQGSSAEGYSKFHFKVGGNANDETERIHATRSVLKHTDLLMAVGLSMGRLGLSMPAQTSMSISSSPA